MNYLKWKSKFASISPEYSLLSIKSDTSKCLCLSKARTHLFNSTNTA